MSNLTITKYSALMRLLHWLMAIMIVGLLGVGVYMTGLSKEDPSRGELYGWHKSFGVLALLLFFVRVVVRWLTAIPPLPVVFSSLEKRVIQVGHGLLYILMLVVPLSGYLMSCAAGKGVKLFGNDLMCAVAQHETFAGLMNETHEIAAYILLAVVIGHVLAVIKHACESNPARNILSRMK